MTLTAVVAAIGVNAKAQHADAKITNPNPGGIYIKGGYNAANISINGNGDVDDAHTLNTFHAGVIADIPLAPVFSFQTGLMLNGQGSKTNHYIDNNNHDDNYVKTKFNPAQTPSLQPQ